MDWDNLGELPNSIGFPETECDVVIFCGNVKMWGEPARSYFPAHTKHARAVSPRDWCEDSRLVIPYLPNYISFYYASAMLPTAQHHLMET